MSMYVWYSRYRLWVAPIGTDKDNINIRTVPLEGIGEENLRLTTRGILKIGSRASEG